MTAENLYHVARMIGYRGLYTGGSDFRTLGINHDAYMRRHRSHIAHDGPNAIGLGVGGIYAHHVYARKEELTDKVNVTSQVADGGYYLGLFHLFSK